MKIATWNINSIRLRIELLREFADNYRPDIILLQETKTIDALFPREACHAMGYPYLSISGQKSYNGVAVLSKIPFDREWCISFTKSEPRGDEARHIAVAIGDIEIHNFYVPAGGDEPDPSINPKFAYKLRYLDSMCDIFGKRSNMRTIIGGDLNIAPLEHDVWSSAQLRNVISHTPIEREKLDKFMNVGQFVDIARQFVPADQKLYSWWSYRNQDWRKSNRGRRLDHIWSGAELAHKAKNFLIAKDLRDWIHPSDHVPVIVEFEPYK